MHTSSRRQTSSRRERKREGSDVLARRLHETFSISRFAAREALKGDTKVFIEQTSAARALTGVFKRSVFAEFQAWSHPRSSAKREKQSSCSSVRNAQHMELSRIHRPDRN